MQREEAAEEPMHISVKLAKALARHIGDRFVSEASSFKREYIIAHHDASPGRCRRSQEADAGGDTAGERACLPVAAASRNL